MFIQSSAIKSSGRVRITSGSGSIQELQRQGSSVKRQISTTTPKQQEDLKNQVSVKDQEEWDKDLPQVSMLRVVRLNAKEWWMIVIGAIASMFSGAIFPLFGLVFGEILGVFSLPNDEIVSGVSLYAGLFWVLGFIAGFGFFLKVN